jgi:uncharacterized membrane-anchored protein
MAVPNEKLVDVYPLISVEISSSVSGSSPPLIPEILQVVTLFVVHFQKFHPIN